MNLIEAVKSGRLRRDLNSEIGAYREWHEGETLYSTTNILSQTWEIQEPTVTVTRTQFWEAWEEMLAHERGMRYGHTQFDIHLRKPEHLGQILAKRLGLEP